MKTYYIPSKDGTREQLTEKEYLSLFGTSEQRSYVNKLYCGKITIQEVPEELQEAVQEIVKNRISKYGTYDEQPASTKDIENLVQAIMNSHPTKYEIKRLLTDILTIRDNSTDAVASRTVSIFPTLKHDGSLIKAGTRIRWAGVIKIAAVDLWDTIENNPDDAPNLWGDLNYRDGYRIIPEVITVSTAFSIGEIGWYGDKLYKSLLNANVYTPDQYSAGWEEFVLGAE
jgi:hypothetical protein